MSDNSRFFGVIQLVLSISLIIATGVLIFLSYENRSNTIEKDTYIKNIQFRIGETERINLQLYGSEMSEKLGSFIDSISFRPNGDFLILFLKQDMCQSCIDRGLNLLARLEKLKERLPILIIGGFGSQREFSVLANTYNVKSGVYQNYNMASELIKGEEVPIMVRVNSELEVIKACFVDNYLPEEFYVNFIKSF
jgi:hypothetical protein